MGDQIKAETAGVEDAKKKLATAQETKAVAEGERSATQKDLDEDVRCLRED